MKLFKSVGSLFMLIAVMAILTIAGCSSATADLDPDGSVSAPPAGVELADEVELPPA